MAIAASSPGPSQSMYGTPPNASRLAGVSSAPMPMPMAVRKRTGWRKPKARLRCHSLR